MRVSGSSSALALLVLSDHAFANSDGTSSSWVCFTCALLCIGVAALWRLYCREHGNGHERWLPESHEALAFLTGGPRRTLDTAVARLLTSGHLEGNAGFLRRGSAQQRPTAADPIGQALWDALAEEESPGRLCQSLGASWRQLRRDLREAGHLCSAASERRRPLGLLVLPVAAVVCRGSLASALHQHAALTLGSTLLISLLVLAVVWPPLGATWQARLRLRHLQDYERRLQTAACADEWALAVALFGLESMTGRASHPQFGRRQPRRPRKSPAVASQMEPSAGGTACVGSWADYGDSGAADCADGGGGCGGGGCS